MFIRIAGIELKPPILKRFTEGDGGLIVWCEALEGAHGEEKATKALALEGTTQSVKWQDKAGEVEECIMLVIGTQSHERQTPDGKTITSYTYTLRDV